MLLSSVFPGRVAVSPVEIGLAVFGWSAKTTQNRLLAGKFPLPLVEVGGKRVCLLAAVEAALTGNSVGVEPKVAPPAPPKRGPGRPRKIATGG